METYSLNVYLPTTGTTTSAQGYYVDSLEDIKKALKITLGEIEEEIIKTFSFSVNETYEVYSPGKGLRKEQSTTVLPSFIGKTVTEAEEFCNKNGISFNIEYVDYGDNHYNADVAVGLIGDQSVQIGVHLSTVNELTVYVVNSKQETTQEENESEDSEEIIDDILEDLLN